MNIFSTADAATRVHRWTVRRRSTPFTGNCFSLSAREVLQRTNTIPQNSQRIDVDIDIDIDIGI
jgi:hypothetical protein